MGKEPPATRSEGATRERTADRGRGRRARGLRCAHELWNGYPSGPIAATVYEANPERAGGRCWTLRDFFTDGLITEHGGAFIDSNHRAVRRLAASLGLQEEVVNGGDLPTGKDAHWIDGAYYTQVQASSHLELLPGDDEKFHVAGGNDQLVSGMLAELPAGAVQHNYELMALCENSNRTITLSFGTSGGTVDVTADYVVLALPFSTLRNVDLSQSNLSATKQTVIQTLGMGSNAKIHVELERKTWPALGFAGAAYGEWDRFCCAWDDSVPLGADASPALLLGFPGGYVGKSQLTGAAHGSAPAVDLSWFLGEIEPVYPGTSAAYAGRAYEDHWALDPWVLGAYSYYKVGQAAEYGELAAATEGRIHFAGEHTATRYQGFLEGAVITGERAARELHRRVVRRSMARA